MPRRTPFTLAPVLAVGLGLGLVSSACTADRTDAESLGEPTASTECQVGVMQDLSLLGAPGPTSAQAASYSNDAIAPQSKNCDEMQAFISTPQPGFDLQSYVFYGHLRADSGEVIAFSTLSQRSAGGASADGQSTQVGAVTVNAGSGTTFGGVAGTPDGTLAYSTTSHAFSARSQTFSAGSAPQYVDARVVDGQLGEPGAVIELTAQVMGVDSVDPTATAVPMQAKVRVRDVAGVGQWGYGPSGFFPQWIHPDQRAAITEDHGGSIEEYLRATNDPMTNQGSYYYSSPVVEVEEFTISKGTEVVHHGTQGELLIDYVTQTFDEQAAVVVDNGVTWTEFSVLFDDERTMKLGRVEQSSVGELRYAVVLSADGDRLLDGALEADRRWDLDDIGLTPDTSRTWTSPRSAKSYSMRYTATLKGDDAVADSELRFDAVHDDQELSIGGRVVYEGLFAVTGSIDGERVSGYAWAEIQPTGSL